MSSKICPVCGSESVHEYRRHGVWHLRCKCGYDSGDGWREHHVHHDDDEREPERKPARQQGRQR
jgi:ribosomal protein L37AE/L43A